MYNLFGRESLENLKRRVEERQANERVKIVIDSFSKALKEKGFEYAKIELKIESTYILAKLIDGQFPDYERIIPKQKKHKPSLSCADLRLAIQPHVTRFKAAKVKSPGLKLALNRSAKLS